MPNLYKLFVFSCFFIALLIKLTEMTPKTNEIRQIIIPFNNLYLEIKINVELGIKSVIDKQIITLKENAKQNVINLVILCLLTLKNITNDPKTVDKPAMVEISSGINIFNLTPLPFYKYI